MFQEQVSAIGQWFTDWTEPEQMVLLYTLLKRLTPLQVKLLSRVVEQHVSDCAEIQVLEHQANNPAIISNLLTKRKDIAMQQVLQLLPLLRPGSNEAKSRYLSVIPAVLSHAVESGEHLSEAKQLISYSLIHPALASEDRKQLAPWVQILKARFNLTSTAPVLSLGENLLSQQGWRQPKESTRVRRSNSLTPPVSLCHSTAELWAPQNDLCTKQKPRSFSLSSEHVPPLSPQSSQASSGSGSETTLDDSKSFSSDLPGMKDVGCWLKQLRLHKYIWFFGQLTYDEMLNLTEERLEGVGVTKGARHKIILSIQKLRDRHITLAQLEKDVNRGANLLTVLEELKTIVCSPIKPPLTNETANKTEADQEDIPTLLTKVLGKVCTHLIVNNGREDDAMRLCMRLVDQCLVHEAFVPHRRRLDNWKLQLNTLWQQKHQRANRWYQQGGPVGHSLADSRSPRRLATSYPARPTYLLGAQYLGLDVPNRCIPSQMTNGIVHPPSVNFNVSSTHPSDFNLRRPTEQEEHVEKTQETDINSTLEDLCLSMAEHFLEGVS